MRPCFHIQIMVYSPDPFLHLYTVYAIFFAVLNNRWKLIFSKFYFRLIHESLRIKRLIVIRTSLHRSVSFALLSLLDMSHGGLIFLNIDLRGPWLGALSINELPISRYQIWFPVFIDQATLRSLTIHNEHELVGVWLACCWLGYFWRTASRQVLNTCL